MNSERYTITLDDDTMVSKILSKAVGMHSLPFSSVEGLLARAERYQPIAAFIDIHLGTNETGLDIIPSLRRLWPFAVILVVTSDTRGKIIGESLAAGANDFISKPLNIDEVRGRLQARLHEMETRKQCSTIGFADLVFNRNLRFIKNGDGHTKYLSPTEAALLETLISAKGILVTKDELRRGVWGSLSVSNTAIDKKIHDVRAAIKEVSRQVEVRSRYGKGIQIVTRAS